MNTMRTYTGFDTVSDFAFHETPQHPLERIQQRKAVSINNDNNDSAFDNIFEKHPQSSEQYIRRKQTSINIDNNQNDQTLGTAIDTITENSDSENAETHINKHVKDNILGTLKSKAGNLLDSTEIVRDSLNQQKYSRLANASYDQFNSDGDASVVEKGLSDPEYSHLGIEDFKVDKELSSIDNVVLHNKVTGETHISFRGTTDDLKETDQFLSDWNTNRKIMFNPKAAENSTRFTEASAQTEKVIAKYGNRFTTVSGHSQGGGISSLIGQEKDLKGFHFNPAISPKQVSENSKGLDAKNIEKQVIYKSHMDFASPLSYTQPIRKNFSVNLVGTKPGIDNSIVKTHSLDNFAAKGGLNVERNTMVSSMKKSMGTGLSVAAQGYFLSQDIKQDLKTEKLDSYKGTDIGIDIAKNGAQLAGDDFIMGVGAAAAPETLGLSVVAGLGASFIYNMGTDAVAAVSKKAVKSKPIKHIANALKGATIDSANTIADDANDVAHWFKHIHW
jgi:hypothetical protein